LVQQMLSSSPQHRPSAQETYERLKRHLVRERRSRRKGSDTLPQLDVTALRASGLGASQPHTAPTPGPHSLYQSLYQSTRPRRAPHGGRQLGAGPLLEEGERWLQTLETSLQVRDFDRSLQLARRFSQEAATVQEQTLHKLSEALIALCQAQHYEESMALYHILRSCYYRVKSQ
jgi:hypothetical protein